MMRRPAMAVLIHISAKGATGQSSTGPLPSTAMGAAVSASKAGNIALRAMRVWARLIPGAGGSYNRLMPARALLRIVPAALCASAVLLAASCATSKGSALGTVSSARAAAASSGSGSPPQEPAQNPPGTTKGLQVLSDPSSAEIWIDGDYKGLSPYVMEDIPVGWHRVVLRKDGYYESSGWVEFKGDPVLYQVSLSQIIGFLQVSATPADVTVTVDGTTIGSGTQQVPVGTHEVTIRSFGWTPWSTEVTIAEKAVTAVSVALQPAPFDVTDFSIPKKAVNPWNPGLIGSIELDFSVTGPGTGVIRVTDASGMVLYTRSLPQFTTWGQSFTWDVRTIEGQALADGVYTLAIEAAGPDGTAPVTRDAQFTVDSSIRVVPRSMWSGSSGLLYAPVAEVLPEGDFQVSLLGAGVADISNIQVPVQVGVRFSAMPGMEVDASAGLIGTGTILPLFASVTARWGLLAPHGGIGTSAAIQAKVAAQVITTQNTIVVDPTDTFANFTGISVEVPLQLTVGALSGLLSFGATGSLWYPYLQDSSGAPIFGPVAWLYFRAGIVLDLGPVTAGISASTRTQRLPGGYAFLSWPIPFEAGAEVHWLLPGTRLLVSAFFAGEYRDSSYYYFMGGGGLGFLY